MTRFRRGRAPFWQVLYWSAAVMACSSAATAGGVTVDEAWVRAMPPGQSVTALYFTVENNSGESCTLTSVSTPEASRTELHRTTEEDGVARMRLQASIDIQIGRASCREGVWSSVVAEARRRRHERR